MKNKKNHHSPKNQKEHSGLHIFIKNIFLYSLLFFSINHAYSQKGYLIKNRTWDVCIKKNALENDSTCNYVWSYTFISDGSFIEFIKDMGHSVEIKNTKWNRKGKKLILTTTRNDEIKNIRKLKIYWIDNFNFYTLEKQKNGVKVHSHYKAIN